MKAEHRGNWKKKAALWMLIGAVCAGSGGFLGYPASAAGVEAQEEESASEEAMQASISEEAAQESALEDETQKSVSEDKTQKSASEGETQKSVSEDKTQKSVSEDETQKSASEDETQKGASEDETQKGASEGETQKSASRDETQERASEDVTEGSVSLDALNEAIAAAGALNTGNATSESVKLLHAAVAYAREIANDRTAEQKQIDAAADLVTKAGKALMEKESGASALDKAKSGSYDGVYTVSGKLWHATSKDQASMGNDAIVKPIEVNVENGSPVLHMEFVPLTSKLGTMQFTGYLGKLNYFPGYYEAALPTRQTPEECEVESYYDIFDDYNKAKTGTDANMRGKKYPQYVLMPVKFDHESYYVQVYVPVMEAISAGSGTQYAKLAVDWSTLKQISGAKRSKTKLQTVVNLLSSYRAAYNAGKINVSFSKAQKSLLSAGESAGKAAVSAMNISQTDIDEMTQALTAVKQILNVRKAADKKALLAAIEKADTYLKKTSVYTAASLKKLKTARSNAQTVYDDYLASQSAVNKQTKKINAAIKALKKKTVSSKKEEQTESTKTEQTESGKTDTKKKPADTTAATGEKVSFYHLKDGSYTITGQMIKIDKKTPSMANDAVNHTMKLTVKNGAYYITMDFNGLQINAMTGYLGELKYFKSGYRLDANGSPQGELGSVTVDAYQKDSDGKTFRDALGTNYPDIVTFPLISEAKKDGWVPLQVFVPVMESISAGTGTQPVFLKLDPDSVRTGYTASSNEAADSGNTPSSEENAVSSGSNGGIGGSSLTSNTLGSGSLTSAVPMPSADGLSENGSDQAEVVPDVTAMTPDDTEMTLDAAGSIDNASYAAADAEPNPAKEQEPPLRRYVKPTLIVLIVLVGALLGNTIRKLRRTRRQRELLYG